jgi:hypothetical protein
MSTGVDQQRRFVTAGRRAWIAGHGEHVPIVDVVDTYAGIADEFDRWLADRIGVKYRADIEAFRRVP